MKQQISGPVGIAIVVVIVLVLVYFGYSRVVKGPDSITPEQMRTNMMKGQEMQRTQGQRRGPGGGMPGGPAGTGGAPAGSSAGAP